VVVGVEAEPARAQPTDVEPGVAGLQRVDGPPHSGDAAFQTPDTLVCLERGPRPRLRPRPVHARDMGVQRDRDRLAPEAHRRTDRRVTTDGARHVVARPGQRGQQRDVELYRARGCCHTRASSASTATSSSVLVTDRTLTCARVNACSSAAPASPMADCTPWSMLANLVPDMSALRARIGPVSLSVPNEAETLRSTPPRPAWLGCCITSTGSQRPCHSRRWKG